MTDVLHKNKNKQLYILVFSIFELKCGRLFWLDRYPGHQGEKSMEIHIDKLFITTSQPTYYLETVAVWTSSCVCINQHLFSNVNCHLVVVQGVPQHWTPENLAMSQALYKHELNT